MIFYIGFEDGTLYVETDIYNEITQVVIEDLHSDEKAKAFIEQTDCQTCKHSSEEEESDECYTCSMYYNDNYEPQTGQPCDGCEYSKPYIEYECTHHSCKFEDEPQQKSCATCKHALGNWDGESNNCGRCCGADRIFYEPIEDEPQTDGYISGEDFMKIFNEPQKERSEDDKTHKCGRTITKRT